MNDASTDTTQRIAELWRSNDDRFACLNLPKNSGVAKARNAGFAAFAGGPEEMVVFLDSDDVWNPDALSLLVDHLAEAPRSAVAFGAASAIDESGKHMNHQDVEHRAAFGFTLQGKSLVRENDIGRFGFTHVAIRQPVMTPGLAIARKSSVLETLRLDTHLFDQSLSPCEDWDFWIRMTRLGDFKFFDVSIIKYRQHCGNASKNSIKLGRGARRMRHKVLSDAALTDAQRMYAYTAYRAWWIGLIRDRSRKARAAIGTLNFKVGSKLLALTCINLVDLLLLHFHRPTVSGARTGVHLQ